MKNSERKNREKRGESAARMILPLCITCILFGPVGVNLGYVIAGICPPASVSHNVCLDRCGSRKIMLLTLLSFNTFL